MFCYETREHMGTFVSEDGGGRMYIGLNPFIPCTMLTIFTGIITTSYSVYQRHTCLYHGTSCNITGYYNIKILPSW